VKNNSSGNTAGEAGCETCVQIVLLLALLRNNNMATNIHVFTSSYGSKWFAVCEC